MKNSKEAPTNKENKAVKPTAISCVYEIPENRLSRPCGGQCGFDDYVEQLGT